MKLIIFDDKERDKAIDWFVRMVFVWFCSFLLYMGVTHGAFWAWWILGTICFIELADKFNLWEDKDDSDN